EFLSIDNKGALVPLSPRLAMQCGYGLTVDFLGNAKFLASVLSCFAQNTKDETNRLTVQISVFSNNAMTSASSYVQSMMCPYSPWAEREILCERNYMEVSVRRGVPLIEPNVVQDDPDWSLAYPEATSADNSIWKIVFHLPANRKQAMTVAQGSCYSKSPTPLQQIQTVPMAILRLTTDGTAFTEEMITWNVPRVLPLVPTPQITTLDVQMGVDGRKLDPAAIQNRGYKLDVDPQLITVSHVLDNTYVISYSIEPMLAHTWQDGPEKTKYTVIHAITTLTVPEANLKGYNVQEHVFPNGSKTYTLQVPFEDPNVKQKVTPTDTRTYILPLTYLLNVVPENTLHSSCCSRRCSQTSSIAMPTVLPLVVPPTVAGYCDGAAFYTFDNNLLTYENEVLFTSYRLRVACHYLVNDTKVVQFLYQNNPAPGVQPGLGDLAVIMRLALVEDYPVVKYLRRPLYFEVELLYSRDPQAELFLDNCWATYSADRTSSPKWDVAVDSCENSADESLTIFHTVSSNARVLFPSHLKRFEVKMFSFTSGQDALKGQVKEGWIGDLVQQCVAWIALQEANIRCSQLFSDVSIPTNCTSARSLLWCNVFM
ncbi:ZP2 protein, partial [Polyodon spathula]|nr:ZP2 protein [Polyodon spathula]